MPHDPREGIPGIFGTEGSDIIVGNGAYVLAYRGNDIIFVNRGYGYVDGGPGRDNLSFYYADGPVAVDMQAGTARGTNPAQGFLDVDFNSIEIVYGSNWSDSVFGSFSNDTIHGWGGSDRLDGRAGDDTINGGSGADKITGGAGIDQLYGGAGNDQFIFKSSDTGDLFADRSDTIWDFEQGDRILIDEELVFTESDPAPDAGEYSIWEKDGHFVVTWNSGGSYHDIIVHADALDADDIFIGDYILI